MDSVLAALLSLFLGMLHGPTAVPSLPQTSLLQERPDAHASSQRASTPCSLREGFSGEVKSGEQYDQILSNGLFLTFHLRDVQMEGWQIEILPKEAGPDGKRRDWAWPLNPPYHGYNSQNVSVSYGFTAKDVVEYGPREFRFPINKLDAEMALRLYDKLESSTGERLDEAMQELETFPSAKGRFEILDSQLSPGSPGRIDWLKFKVTIALPCRPAADKP